MRHLLLSLVVFPALLSAFQVVRYTNPPPLSFPQDATIGSDFKLFSAWYSGLLATTIQEKTAEAMDYHMFYVDKGMQFIECNAVTHLHYDDYVRWFKAYVLAYSDPVVKRTSVISTGKDMGEMYLNVEAGTEGGFRENFDMKVAAMRVRYTFAPSPENQPDATIGVTFKEFAKWYKGLFAATLQEKTAQGLHNHMFYVDKQMSFIMCHEATNMHYPEFLLWFQSFMLNYKDPVVKITSVISTGKDIGEMILNVEAGTDGGIRENFDVKIGAMRDDTGGWKILIVNRALGCT
ncbi:hypothetical protein B9Z55_011817 [Caenorhabditis nigoni]|uniref:SnoaL-like domain-containing protein n=1 Tax=Caenorhabditis nigoni TaxID=1611254 RepID=A0A2G5ULP4_9PELO|nr:hypothetical protein B9Z55_011817 [Caenorhabditis nigoni]